KPQTMEAGVVTGTTGSGRAWKTRAFSGAPGGRAEEALEGRDDHGLHERRRVPDAGDRDELALRQGLDHATGLRLGEDVAVLPPHHQGRTRHARESGPERRPRRRALLDALADVFRVHLPDPPAVGALAQHAERQLALVLEAAPGHDGRHLAAI